MIAPLVLFPMLLGITVEVNREDGSQLQGSLLEVTSEQVKLSDASGEQVIEARQIQVMTVGGGEASPNSADVVRTVDLRDGSSVKCLEITGAGDSLSIELGEHRFQLPRAALKAAQLQAVPDGNGEQWERLTANDNNADVVIVITRSGGLRAVEGVIGEISLETVKFKFDGEWIDVSRDKVVGLIWFSGAAPKLKPAACKLVLANGSELELHRLTVRDQQFEIEIASGAELSIPASFVSRLNFAASSTVYLSDIPPETTEQAEYLFFAFPKLAEYDRQLFGIRDDATVSNQALKADVNGTVQEFPRGIGIHSDARLVYRLAGDYRRFAATAVVDAVSQNEQQIELKILLDGKEVESQLLRSGEDPVGLDVNLTGANRMEIQVLSGGDSNAGDHLNLCDARLMK